MTAQRTRVRELTNFAGMVAHDLRAPLTVLDGWLEVLEDHEVRSTPLGAEIADKAKDASRRMRQVIEDWLGYTVVQNGKPRPEAVKLVDAVSEIVDSRQVSASATSRSSRWTSTTRCSPTRGCCASCSTTWSATP